MRVLLPDPRDEVDLDAVHAVPAGRPWLRATMVASVDGAASVDGRSGGLSGPADKALFALLRDLCDAILVGAGTARAEAYGAVKTSETRVARRRQRGLPDVPTIAVVTRRLDLDPAGPLFTGALAPTVLVTTEAAAARRGSAYDGVAELVTTPGDDVDLSIAVAALRARGLHHLLCEGGPLLLGQVVAAGLLDELCLTVSPVLAGGSAGRLAAGPALVPPHGLRLAGLMEDDGTLFTRWQKEGT